MDGLTSLGRGWTVFLAGLVTSVLALPRDAAIAQNTSTSPVTGAVLDAETGEPLIGAHVFYEETTIGDITDSEGRFSLRAPPFASGNLIVSMLGYELTKKPFEASLFDGQYLEIRLKSTVLELDEITIEARSSRSRRQNLARFKELFFSTTDFGRHCRIDNEEALRLAANPINRTLSAKSTEPLRITNPDLGYELLVHGLAFEGDEAVYRFTGRIQFREMTPESDSEREKWLRNRRKAYLGSMRHFFRSLVRGRLKEEGFAAYHVADVGQVSTASPIAEMASSRSESAADPRIISDMSLDGTHLLSIPGILLVEYTREVQSSMYDRYVRMYAPGQPGNSAAAMGRNQMSWIEVPLGVAMVDNAGRVFSGADAYPITHYGYWAWERFGDALPTDYDPDAE